jgi:hypothetical protein
VSFVEYLVQRGGLGGTFADACKSDREIDAIPGTYDDAKGKKYPAVNRQVDSLDVVFWRDAGWLTSCSGEYLVKRLTATY